ncbi:MAG: peptidylprolyl isomerase [Bacteroidota bacterium]
MKSEIKSKVSRDVRSEMTRKSFLQKLESEYNLQVDNKCYKPLYKAASRDSAFLGKGLGPVKNKTLNKTLVSFADQERTVGQFVQYLGEAKIKNKSLTSEEVVDQQLDKYIEEELLAYEDSRLEQKHRDFRLLMNEYHDGILLFELTDQKVWSKAVKDTTGLEAFYQENKDSFMWKERARAVTYRTNDMATAKKVQKLLDKGKSMKDIKDQINKDSKLNLRTEQGTYERGEDAFLDSVEWAEGITDVIEDNGQFVVIVFEKVIAPEPKKLDEARGLVTAEYQNFLEQQWIEQLRSKYDYQVNKEVLHTIK